MQKKKKPSHILNWASMMVQTVKKMPANAGDSGSIPGLRRSSGEGDGSPYSIAWRILWTEKPGRLQSMGSQRVDMTERLTFSLFMYLITTITNFSEDSLKVKQYHKLLYEFIHSHATNWYYYYTHFTGEKTKAKSSSCLFDNQISSK